MARTTEKHSNVYYTLNNPVGDGSRTNTGFTPHEQAVGVKNNFGADMFKLYGCVFRKRLKHAIVFYIVAECAFLLKALILAYYA